MKDLFIELNKRRSSFPKRIFSIFIILIIIIWFVYQATHNNLTLFNVVYGILLLISGVVQLYDSIGNYPFGKSYLILTEEKLEVKLTPFSKRMIFQWREVKDAKIGMIDVGITDNENRLYTIDLSYLDYQTVKEVKEKLKELSDKLGISEDYITT